MTISGIYCVLLIIQRRAAAGPERDGRDDRGDEARGEEGRPDAARNTQVRF